MKLIKLKRIERKLLPIYLVVQYTQSSTTWKLQMSSNKTHCLQYIDYKLSTFVNFYERYIVKMCFSCAAAEKCSVFVYTKIFLLLLLLHKHDDKISTTNKLFSRGNEIEKRDGKEMAFCYYGTSALAYIEMSSDCRRIYCFKKTWNWDLRAEPAIPPLRKALLCVCYTLQEKY